jgi:glyoxylase-like metal-dependent hydrolase (beta-lactamase superfamily II)
MYEPSEPLLHALLTYSQVHWDHVGEPRDFDKSTFVVGHGALDLLNGSSSSLRGSHSHFEADLLPASRTVELRNPYEPDAPYSTGSISSSGPDFGQAWGPHPHYQLPRVLDLFHDGSVLIVDAPGHLPGHINVLARTSSDNYIYLAGDACHDRRIMTGEKEIGEWQDGEGHICCIHGDKKLAEQTIDRIRTLEKQGVEIVFAHDWEWEERNKEGERFLGCG